MSEIPFSNININLKCYNIGFISGRIPLLDLELISGKLRVKSFNSFTDYYAVSNGYIMKKIQLDLNSNDITLNNISVYQTSYGGCVGMSGGPLINTETGEILGIMSFGLPKDSFDKTNLFSISIDEIRSKT